VISVCTKEAQTIDASSLANCGKVSAKNNEFCIQFDKAGVIAAMNEYTFGKIYWEVKLQQQSAHQSADDSSSLMKIGVTNKVGKLVSVTGSLINYGLSKTGIRIRLILDMDNRTLTIHQSNLLQPEIITNLPEGPLYPAFQNKTNKNCVASVKLLAQFDLPAFDNEKNTKLL
jgi:hypothetical protein